MVIYYIYSIECPITEQVKYIGSSYMPKARFKEHLNAAKRNKNDKPLYVWIRHILALGKSPVFNILFVCDYNERIKKEVETIKHYSQLGTLLNIRLEANYQHHKEVKKAALNNFPLLKHNNESS